jgi:hypothetical protein
MYALAKLKLQMRYGLIRLWSPLSSLPLPLPHQSNPPHPLTDPSAQATQMSDFLPYHMHQGRPRHVLPRCSAPAANYIAVVDCPFASFSLVPISHCILMYTFPANQILTSQHRLDISTTMASIEASCGQPNASISPLICLGPTIVPKVSGR